VSCVSLFAKPRVLFDFSLISLMEYILYLGRIEICRHN